MISARTRLVLGAMALFATDAAAQFVWPAGYASTPGNAVMNAPFTSQPGHPYNRTRCTVVMDPSSLPFPIGTALTSISLRRDSIYAGQAYGSHSGALVVRIGRAAAVPAQTNDVRFQRLWEDLPATVFLSNTQTPFVLPAAPAPGTAPAPFNVTIPFTQPFTWNGGPLAIEFDWSPLAGSTRWRVDAFATSVRNGSSATLGLGCVGSNGFAPTHFALPETTMPGATLTFRMEGAPALGGAAVHLLGLGNTNYQGIPLPFDLGTIGAPPGCQLRVDFLLSSTALVVPTALFGRATIGIPIPATTAAVGVALYSQWLIPDFALPVAFPFTVSDAQVVTLGQVANPPLPPRARTIWRYGSNGINESGQTVVEEYGPVIRFN